jgi:hypothetical protein
MHRNQKGKETPEMNMPSQGREKVEITMQRQAWKSFNYYDSSFSSKFWRIRRIVTLDDRNE